MSEEEQKAEIVPAAETTATEDVMKTTVHAETDPVVTAKELLAVGAHYGHQARRWNPAMKPYIYTKRNNLHIIDLNKTTDALQKAYLTLKKIVEEGGKVLFVGTKPTARETIVTQATRSGSFYASNRWLGGTLTNFKTIAKRIRLLKNLQDEADNGLLDKLTKKEASAKIKERERLNALVGGIKEMRKVPNAIIIVDTKYEHNAVHEAKLLHIPSFGLVDTNCNPADVTFPIPMNVDGIEAVKLVIGILADAVVAGKGGEAEFAYKGVAENGKPSMKDLLPAQFSMNELRVIHSKIREDIFEAKRKGKKKRKKVVKKKFVKKPMHNKPLTTGDNPAAGEAPKVETEVKTAPVGEKTSEQPVAEAKTEDKVELKDESEAHKQ